MDFKYYIGTKAIFGKGCVVLNKEIFSQYGKKAVIVTGKSSAKESGALEDVLKVLLEMGINYMIYDSVENNPSLENVKDAGDMARKYGGDFVIGIGGGSPLDASKAVAVLAANDIEPVLLYKNSFQKKPLPIIAIPTTAGTGSEITPYSILTRKDMETKMSFGNEDTFPKVALLDPLYTMSMSYETTVNTGVDAFTHALEGYLSKRSMPVSDILAQKAMEIFGECVRSLLNKDLNLEVREKLLYMSMLGGMVISHTGTTIIHGLGYSLTYFKDIPHGKANGYIIEEYLKYNYEAAKEKIDKVLKLLNVSSINEFGQIINKLLGERVKLSNEESNLYSSLAMKQRSTSFNKRDVKEEDLKSILAKAFMND